jgi:hypothetical protein
MLPRLAEAVGSLFGDRLAGAASFARTAAQIALVAAVTLAVVRAALALTSLRYGWETALVVRCPRCRRLVADPDTRACPSGHPVRFPRGAARRESRRRRFHGLRRVVASSRVALPASVAVAAAAGFLVCGVARVEGAVASLAASAAYLFFLAAVTVGALAVAPGSRGPTERAVHAGAAAACLVPAIVLALLARAFEPPRPRAIGSLWSTPTALYVSTGGRRARRVADARSEVEALLVDVRAPAFGIVWRGLDGFRSGERVVRWRGRGGFSARLLSRWGDPLSRRGVLLGRSTETVRLPPNVKVWIVARPGDIRFTTEGSFDRALPRASGPPRRTG